MFKSAIRIVLVFFSFLFCLQEAKAQNSYVSLSPAITEIIYAIGAQDGLSGVSTECDYPAAVQKKPKIGNTYYVNKELIIRLKPDYIFADAGSEYAFNRIYSTKTKPVFFRFESLNDIYKNIYEIGKYTEHEKEAQILVSSLKKSIYATKEKEPKRILYLVQTNPMISIGEKSFISDVIKASGQISVTEELKTAYPSISKEFALKAEPQIVVAGFRTDNNQLYQLFPHSKIIFLSKETLDFINRPGPRIYKAVQYFSRL